MRRTPLPANARVAARAVKLYMGGCTGREVGAALGVDDTTVISWVGEAARRRGPRGRGDVADELILRLRNQECLSYAAIAETVGMSTSGVRMRYYALTGRQRPDRASARD